MFESFEGHNTVKYLMASLLVALGLYALRWLIKTAFGKPSTTTEGAGTQSDAVVTAEPERVWPKCECCGTADATEARPLLAVRRTGFVRFLSSIYALPPMYARQVVRPERVEDLAFCGGCAPLADVMTDRFVTQDVRGMFAARNEEIAVAVSRFMREELLQRMKTAVGDGKKVPVAVQLTAVSKLPSRAPLGEKATGTE